MGQYRGVDGRYNRAGDGRCERIGIRCTRAQRAEIIKRARARGDTISAYIIGVAVGERRGRRGV